MTIILVLLGMVLAALAAGALAGIMIDRWLRENRKIAVEIAEYESRGKHAASLPRRTPAPPPARARPERIVWERETGPVEVPRSYAEWRRSPVILPEPGAYLPQAGRDSGAGTETLAKLTDTGAMRAITERTDETIARQSAENAAWLAEWSASA